MSKERRRAQRFAIQHLIELDYGKEQFVRATGLNISTAGVLCKTEPQIEPYTRVFLSLKLPGDHGEEVINCEGIVLRSERINGEHTTAIAFTSFDPNESEKFLKLMGRQSTSDDTSSK